KVGLLVELGLALEAGEGEGPRVDEFGLALVGGLLSFERFLPALQPLPRGARRLQVAAPRDRPPPGRPGLARCPVVAREGGAQTRDLLVDRLHPLAVGAVAPDQFGTLALQRNQRRGRDLFALRRLQTFEVADALLLLRPRDASARQLGAELVQPF